MTWATLQGAALFLSPALAALAAERPLPVPMANSAVERWLKKPVLETRLLDDMESAASWSLQGPGEISLTAERFRDGGHALRLRARTKGDKPGRSLGRPFGSVSAVRRFPGEDWRRFNRVSFWVYPDSPGFFNVSMLVRLHNEGAERVPDVYNREGFNYAMLRNREWNHVVWEIAQFTVMSGDITGSIPVGIKTRADRDEPYWPVQNCYTYKEVWVHPVSRWLWILADLL